MIQVSASLAAAIAATANQPVDLYELYLDSGTLYYADQQIAWGGHNYQARVESRSAIKRFDGGEFDQVSVTFSNVDFALAGVVLTQDIEGRRLIIRKIDRTVADDSIVLFNGEMDRPSKVDELTVTIEARQIIGSIDEDAPSRCFSTTCPFEPGTYECSVGAGTACDKSWSRCAQLGNTAQFGGFRFIPHGGTYQYTEVEKKRFLLFFSRKKKKTITAAFAAVDDTPYDVPIPIVYGRVQIAGVDIQHEDQGGVTKVLSALCAGSCGDVFYVRANQAAVQDFDWHHGYLGAANGIDPRFPQSYPYSLVAYLGCTIPSEVTAVDPAPQITAVVQGKGVRIFGPGGVFQTWAWSDNPIWCVRDFMTTPAAQGGLGIPQAWMDDAVHYEEASYCSELITDVTNDQKIYNPPVIPEAVSYKRYRSTGISGADPFQDGPYDDYVPGTDDDTSRTPPPLQVKRFTLNVAIAQQDKAIDILYKKLLPSFRGYITFSKEGKIQIRVERPVPNTTVSAASSAGANEIRCAAPSRFSVGNKVLISPLTASAEALTVSQVLSDRLRFTANAAFPHFTGDQILKIAMAFDDSNIIGGVTYPLCDRQPSTNRITIKYVDAPAGFEERELRVNDYEHQAQVHRVNNEDLDGSAIDSYFQAWRIGEWKRAKMRDLGRFCELRADIKATLLEIGDVVAVSAAETGLQAVPFRVIEASFESEDEVLITGQLYSIGIYDDAAPQTTITVPAIFKGPTMPGQDIPGDLRPIGEAPFLLEQYDEELNTAFDIEYDPPSPVGVFSGVTAHWVPDGAAKPAAATDFDCLSNREATGIERHGACLFWVTQPADADTPGRVYLTKRSKSYKETLVLFGNPGASPSVQVTIPKSGQAVPGDIRPINGQPFLCTPSDDGLNATFDLEYDPPSPVGVFSGATAHWVPNATLKPSAASDFDYLGNAEALDATRHGRARFTLPEPSDASQPGRIYLTKRSKTYKEILTLFGQTGASPSVPVTLPKMRSGGGPDVKDTSTANVWYKTVSGKRVFGFEGKVVPPDVATNCGGWNVYLHWIERWIGDPPDGTPVYDNRYLQIESVGPAGGAWHANEPGWPLDKPGWSQYVDVVYVARNLFGAENADRAHAFFVRLLVSSEEEDTPLIAGTAKVWTRDDPTGRVFGFGGTVAAAAKIFLHWIEGWDGDVPIYDDRYLEVRDTGVNGGFTWTSDPAGWKLEKNFSQKCDVVFKPIIAEVLDEDPAHWLVIRLTVTGAAGGPADGIPLFVTEEPKGLIDGVNRVFTLAMAPSPKDWCLLSLNGVIQHPRREVNIDQNVLTYADPPRLGGEHHCWYVVGRGPSGIASGNARQFSGGTDAIDYGGGAEFALTEALGLAFWVKLSADAAGCILKRGYRSTSEPQNDLFEVNVQASAEGWNIGYYHDYGPSVAEAHTFDAHIPNDAWHYVGVSRDAATKTVSLYLGDGSSLALIETWSYAANPTGGGDPACRLMIGNCPGGDGSQPGDQAFVGCIQEHMIWNRALSQDEHIAAMLGAAIDAGLLLRCQMGSSPEQDVSGNAHSGIVTGTTLVSGHA